MHNRRLFRNVRPLNALFCGLAIMVLLAIWYPALDPLLFDNRRAFARVLAMHHAGRALHFPGQQPFLFLSWFPNGRPKRAYCYTASRDGSAAYYRVLYSYAIQGWKVNREKADAFRAMQQLTELPEGLSSPTEVTCARLLIVSRRVQSTWVTRYYDRQHLPARIADMLRLAGIDLSADGRERAGLSR